MNAGLIAAQIMESLQAENCQLRALLAEREAEIERWAVASVAFNEAVEKVGEYVVSEILRQLVEHAGSWDKKEWNNFCVVHEDETDGG